MNHGNSGYTMGCRCDECRMARNRYNLAHSRAQQKVMQWVRANRPGLWDEALNDELESLSVERRPRGRPRVSGIPIKAGEA